MKIKLCQTWERYDKDTDTWYFNHLQYGWTLSLTPKGINEKQIANWENSLWRTRHCFLYDYKVMCS